MKRFVSFMTALVMMVSVLGLCPNSSSFEAHAATAEITSQDIVNKAVSKVNDYYLADRCLSFVDDLFAEFGASRDHSCCAHKLGSQIIRSNSMYDIPIGADVFFVNSSGWYCDICGNIPGHIGIYIGDDRYNIKVENCYHIGDVSADSNAAQIIGASELNGNKSTTVELLNCYYLKGNEAVNGEYTKADVNPTPANLLKHIAEDLGSAFSSNTDTELNDGYPVLAWQTESKTIGDINNDGRIGIADAVLLQRHLLNCAPLSANRGYAADINQDNIIDVFDITWEHMELIQYMGNIVVSCMVKIWLPVKRN